MLPSNNLFNVATGKVAYVPTLDSALGLYKMSLVKGPGTRSFASQADVLKAVQQKKLNIDELATVKGTGKTTAGRILLASALPDSMQKIMLTEHKSLLDKAGINKLYSELANNHSHDFGESANALKDLGFDASYGIIRLRNPETHIGAGAILAAEMPKGNMQTIAIGTHSLSLKDFTPDKEVRDPIVKSTQKRVDIINGSGLSKGQGLGL